VVVVVPQVAERVAGDGGCVVCVGFAEGDHKIKTITNSIVQFGYAYYALHGFLDANTMGSVGEKSLLRNCHNYGIEKMMTGKNEKTSSFSNGLTLRVANGLILLQILCLR
jgi:hypothetical protein